MTQKLGSKLVLNSREIAAVIDKNPGTVSIIGRIEKWPGRKKLGPRNAWRVPASFISKRFGIPEEKIPAKLKFEKLLKAVELDIKRREA